MEEVVTYPFYYIVNVKTHTMLADNLSLEQVDQWWKENGDKYFGVATVRNCIQVVESTGND